MIKYILAVLLLVTNISAEVLTQSGEDVSLVAPGTGRLLLGTTGAKGIKLATGQGGTVLGWQVDSSGVLKPLVGTESFAPSTLAAGDGTAAAPTYSFSADSDTGIYRSGTNTIGFTAGAATRLTMSSSGLNPVSAGGMVLGTSSLPYGEVYAGNGTINTYLTYSASESRGLVGTSSNHNLGLRANSSTKALVRTNGHFQLTTTGTGIILVSPDGTCSLCTVDNSDVFSCASTSC